MVGIVPAKSLGLRPRGKSSDLVSDWVLVVTNAAGKGLVYERRSFLRESFWTFCRPSLFKSEGDRGVHAHRSACREKRCDSSDEKHQTNAEAEAEWISCLYSPNDSLKHPCCGDASPRAKSRAKAHHAHRLAKYHAQNVAWFRAQCHANTDFAGSFTP